MVVPWGERRRRRRRTRFIPQCWRQKKIPASQSVFVKVGNESMMWWNQTRHWFKFPTLLVGNLWWRLFVLLLCIVWQSSKAVVANPSIAIYRSITQSSLSIPELSGLTVCRLAADQLCVGCLFFHTRCVSATDGGAAGLPPAFPSRTSWFMDWTKCQDSTVWRCASSGLSITIRAPLEQMSGFRRWNAGVLLLWNGLGKCCRYVCVIER